jgi:hypothetical protein
MAPFAPIGLIAFRSHSPWTIPHKTKVITMLAEYRLASSSGRNNYSGPDGLEYEVASMIELGFLPHGSPFMFKEAICQAMLKSTSGQVALLVAPNSNSPLSTPHAASDPPDNPRPPTKWSTSPMPPRYHLLVTAWDLIHDSSSDAVQHIQKWLPAQPLPFRQSLAHDLVEIFADSKQDSSFRTRAGCKLLAHGGTLALRGDKSIAARLEQNFRSDYLNHLAAIASQDQNNPGLFPSTSSFQILMQLLVLADPQTFLRVQSLANPELTGTSLATWLHNLARKFGRQLGEQNKL